MAILKSFKGIRPPKDKAKDVAVLPYDVMNSTEARAEAEGNPYSLLHVTKSEIDLPEDIDVHDQAVYDKATENFKKFQEDGILVQDSEKCLYVYAQTMDGRTQYGLLACASVNDYWNNVIKKHELTRPDKEKDRMIHVRICNANVEPVFISYRAVKEIDDIVAKVVQQPAEYDFTANDGIGHQLWVIDNSDTVSQLEELFREKVPCTYVADGHHRTAAAALVGNEKKNQNPMHSGKEEYNFFLAVHFPDNHLKIIDYNRVVKDLNGLGKDEFLKEIEKSFDIDEVSEKIIKPDQRRIFSMYLEGKWYKMTAKNHTYDDNDPIKSLDVTILSQYLLDDVLGISDLRTDKRIDFVGGIRGLDELEKRVESGNMKVAFALYPVSMDELINISDTNNIMPPKTTWFEPKLRSGLVIHSLEG